MRTHAVLLIALLTAALSLPVSAQAEQTTLLVLSFDNQTADRNLDWLGDGLAELLVARLNEEQELYVFDREERGLEYDRLGIPETVSVSRATAMKIGWDVGADKVVVGMMAGTPGGFTISARIIDLRNATSSAELKVTGKLDDVIPLAATLAQRVARTLVPASVIPESDFTSRHPVPRSAFEDYIRAMLTGDPQRRAELLQDAVRLDPQYTAAIYQLGRAYHMDRDFKASSPWLEKLQPGAPDYAQAQFMLGLNAYYLGDTAKAVTIFSSLPPSYDVLVNLGAALAGRPDAGGATLAWKRATELDPLGSEALFNLAYFALARGDADGASHSMEQFLKLQGRDGEALYLQGKISERLGRADEAQRLIAQAVRLSPRIEKLNGAPLPNLVRVRPAMNPTQARLPLFSTIWTDPRLARRADGLDLAAWLEAIDRKIDSELYGDSLRDLNDVVRVFPQSPDAHLMLGQVYELQKQYEMAAAEYQRAIQLKAMPDSYLTLARLYRTLGQTAAASQAVDAALLLQPDNVAALSLKADLARPGSRRRRQ